ncbi:DUF6948 domain-containing protein [Azorhizobium caulinodans]|uniref:DUF6948 domain-containing protein n=1 Tax=Azorhizobium caulinodans TaxID=7 RepID=UPI002FBE8EBF
MDIDNLTIGQAKQLAAMFGAVSASTLPSRIAGDGRPVIVRSRDAGVQFGYLDGYDGSTVYLKNARQMWSWTAAEGGTLLDCATHGVKAGKFSTACSSIVVIGACAIIDCTGKAAKTLESAKWA